MEKNDIKQLADYLPFMQTDDVLAATERVKAHVRTLLEDQGVTMLALLLADVLADTLWHGAPALSDVAPSTSPVLS